MKKLLLSMWAAAVLAACATPAQPWPERVVTIEQLRRTSPLRAQVLIKDKDRDTSRTSTVVLHLHVDAQGRTVGMRVAESSGNPRLDESALQTMRAVRFEPWLVDGVAQPVTVVAPLHFPFRDRAL